MTVTNRIKTIKSLVPFGARLLDVGSDHALLPISLYNDGVIAEAVISDVNRGPLKSGRLNVARLAPGLRASFVLSDGFLQVPADSYDVAAICGMGGELIVKIIRQGGDKARCPLILQPMTHADSLRAYLWEQGFEITEERFVREGSRVYCVLLADYRGVCTDYSYAELFLGKACPDTAEFRYYAEKTAAAAEKRLAGFKIENNRAMIGQTEALIARALECSRA